MAQDLFSDYLREWMPDRLSAASVLEWLERPDTDLSWLLVHTPLSFGASDATPNVLLRLFEHGADSEGWDLVWPRLLTHPLISAYLEGRWERFVLPGAFRAAEKCARPLLEYWALTPQDARQVQLETSPDPAQPGHLPEWLSELLNGYPATPVEAIVQALRLASAHGWILPHQPIQFAGHDDTVPLAFFLATYPGSRGQRFTPGDQAYVDQVLGVFADQPWELPEISGWLRNPAAEPHEVAWLEQGLRSGVLMGRTLPPG